MHEAVTLAPENWWWEETIRLPFGFRPTFRDYVYVNSKHLKTLKKLDPLFKKIHAYSTLFESTTRDGKWTPFQWIVEHHAIVQQLGILNVQIIPSRSGNLDKMEYQSVMATLISVGYFSNTSICFPFISTQCTPAKEDRFLLDAVIFRFQPLNFGV